MTTATRRPDMGDTTISVPEELADELYARKGRGETYADVIRRLLDNESDGDESGAHGPRERSASEDGPDTTPDGQRPQAGARREGAHDHAIADVVDAVADEVLPGSGEKFDARREALHAVVEYLREHGSAEPSDFRRDIYPEHTAGYVDGDDPARSWWKNSMYPALRALADRTDAIGKADTAGKWSYTGAGGDA